MASSHAPIIMLRNALVAMPTAKVSPNPNPNQGSPTLNRTLALTLA